MSTPAHLCHPGSKVAAAVKDASFLSLCPPAAAVPGPPVCPPCQKLCCCCCGHLLSFLSLSLSSRHLPSALTHSYATGVAAYLPICLSVPCRSAGRIYTKILSNICTSTLQAPGACAVVKRENHTKQNYILDDQIT